MNFSPINALQNRTSAHFTEINSMYMQHMVKKLAVTIEEAETKWKSTPD